MLNTAEPFHSSPSIAGYQIQKVIGEGGSSKVYLALDERLQRKVAIKVLKPKNQSDTDRALKEARALAQINHPNVIHIYDIIHQKDLVMLVMEYLQGTTLAKLQRQQVMSIEQKLGLLTQICDGVQAIHDAGILHADLKAENIWVTGQGTVKVLDLGISRSLKNNDTENGTNKSSPSFATPTALSPEQVKGEPLNVKSDIFTFGLLAFYLFAGRFPYPQHTRETFIHYLLNEKPDDAAHILPLLPKALINLLNSCLKTEPNKRPVNFVAVANQLRTIEQDMMNAQALEQVTELLDRNLYSPSASPEDSSKNSKKGRGHTPTKGLSRTQVFVALAIFSALLFIAFVSYQLWQEGRASSFIHSNENPRYVAVLRPKITEQETIAPQQRDIMIATIDDAIRQTLLGIKNIHLISRHETDGLSGSLKQIGQQVAATDIITTAINCTDYRCEITFDRVTSEHWSVVQQKQWFTHFGSAHAMYEEAKSFFLPIFPEANAQLAETQLAPIYITEQSYQEFIELIVDIHIKGNSNDANLKRLEQFITRDTPLFQAYENYRWLVLTLYDDKRDARYLENYRTLLDNAPPEYKNSVFYALDLFWIAIYQQDFTAAESAIALSEARQASIYQIKDLRATLNLKQGKYQQARELFEQLVSLRFDRSHLFNLALCHWYLGNIGETQNRLEQLLALFPNDYAANQLIASLYLTQGELERSIAAYEKILEQGGHSSDMNNLAIAYMLQRKYQRAKELAEKAIQESPNNTSLYLNLADVLHLLQLNDKAQSLYQEVIQRYEGKESLKSYLEKAQAYAHLNDPQAAIKSLNQANKLAPGNTEVAFVSALVFVLLNEPDFAIPKAEEALTGGIGEIWFELPWFDNLCQNQGYQQLFSRPLTCFKS
ncbi:protein kinase [Paraneptunicella aestuarii]|uniref:serine/threonine-protein kinase n=1 Tax=Paraneptunicella aestuarii TaxID=2831148 RepID=UPI001E5D509F|nr:serine/threonine-protein kinase [Paraneptunicella aestuarii]UAA39900.1 protein kinase [Paraneptunicella aestuarii]